MAISTKTNRSSYLSINTNKTVEMIAMKIFKFVEVATIYNIIKVATQSHRPKKLVDF